MVLNGSGAVVWSLLDGSRALDEIAAALAAQFSIPLETARSDAEEMITDLIDSGAAHTVD
jgi:hypothetical protein